MLEMDKLPDSPIRLVAWHNADPLQSFRIAARACWAGEYGEMFAGLSLAVQFLMRGTPRLRRFLSPFDFWVAMKDDKAVGMVGIYTSDEKPREGWVGWFPTHQPPHERDNGPAILQALATHVKTNFLPFNTLRLWTSAHPAYANVNAAMERDNFGREKFVSHPIPFLEPRHDDRGRQMDGGYVLSLHSLYLHPLLRTQEPFPWRDIPFRKIGPNWIEWGQRAFRQNLGLH